MPLDVRPLSTARNITRIALMIALLAGALGFAQLLVQRHAPLKPAIFDPPPNSNSPMPVIRTWFFDWDSASTFTAAPGVSVHCFAFDIPNFSAGLLLPELLQRLTQDGSAVQITPHVNLGGLPANQAQQTYLEANRAEILETAPATITTRQTPAPQLALLRLAYYDNHLIAICFSGDAKNTDAIRKSFDRYCSQGVHLDLRRKN